MSPLSAAGDQAASARRRRRSSSWVLLGVSLVTASLACGDFLFLDEGDDVGDGAANASPDGSTGETGEAAGGATGHVPGAADAETGPGERDAGKDDDVDAKDAGSDATVEDAAPPMLDCVDAGDRVVCSCFHQTCEFDCSEVLPKTCEIHCTSRATCSVICAQGASINCQGLGTSCTGRGEGCSCSSTGGASCNTVPF